MERAKDRRAYLIICSHLKDPPAAETLFPLLARLEELEGDEDPDNDLLNFQTVTAALTPYNNG